MSAGGSYGAPDYSPVSAVRRRTSRNGRRRNSRELDLEETREVLEELVEDVDPWNDPRLEGSEYKQPSRQLEVRQTGQTAGQCSGHWTPNCSRS